MERLLADPGLLRLPLVRHANAVTAGKAEDDLGGLAQAPGRERRHALNAEEQPSDDADRANGGPERIAGHEARAAQQPETLANPDEAEHHERRGRDQPPAHRNLGVMPTVASYRHDRTR